MANHPNRSRRNRPAPSPTWETASAPAVAPIEDTDQQPPRRRGRPVMGDGAKRNKTMRLSPDVIDALRADPRTDDEIVRAGLAAKR
ncbi:MAG: hypothetical protein DI530_17690 [Sphingomonas sp.]|uniref:hypothetical protein n=1 Tax=Sphingomonas sp. TaxID=28214 RepID=UPI000DBBE387|nr:hypothetical protein [Sphingomonas sp.]PZU73096.1 MAG: hypothetical protein DI530_17690 [Sphingomonas sp.]